MISPRWVEISKCRRNKLKSDHGEDIERELIKKLPGNGNILIIEMKKI